MACDYEEQGTFYPSTDVPSSSVKDVVQSNEKGEHTQRALRALVLLRRLRARFGELPTVDVARVVGAEIAVLERWSERMLSAKSLAGVLDGPS